MQLVAHAPLVSIDLIVQNSRGEVLLGLRCNEPAAGFWFVPGGRVRKNERLDEAFARITLAELGVTLSRQKADWQGVYEHFYDTNAGRQPGIETHYVVLAYKIALDKGALLALPCNQQHQSYCWRSPEVISTSEDVHAHCRAYFDKDE